MQVNLIEDARGRGSGKIHDGQSADKHGVKTWIVGSLNYRVGGVVERDPGGCFEKLMDCLME